MTLEERWHYGVLPGKPVSPATKVDLSVDLGELPDCHTSVTASGNGTDVSAALAAAVECPRFVRCRGELRSVAYCQEASVRVIPKDSRSAGLRYMAQVLVLEKVFVDHRGQVTDERLWYSLGGCEVPYEPFPSATSPQQGEQVPDGGKPHDLREGPASGCRVRRPSIS